MRCGSESANSTSPKHTTFFSSRLPHRLALGWARDAGLSAAKAKTASRAAEAGPCASFEDRSRRQDGLAHSHVFPTRKNLEAIPGPCTMHHHAAAVMYVCTPQLGACLPALAGRLVVPRRYLPLFAPRLPTILPSGLGSTRSLTFIPPPIHVALSSHPSADVYRKECFPVRLGLGLFSADPRAWEPGIFDEGGLACSSVSVFARGWTVS